MMLFTAPRRDWRRYNFERWSAAPPSMDFAHFAWPVAGFLADGGERRRLAPSAVTSKLNRRVVGRSIDHVGVREFRRQSIGSVPQPGPRRAWPWKNISSGSVQLAAGGHLT